jgi:rhodanese-related sulfurtransferase
MQNVFLVLCSSILLLSCKAQNKNVIEVIAFEKAVSQKNIQLVDIRTLVEYNKGHIKNALLINWNEQEAFKKGIALLDKNKEIYIYCQAGGRSSAANTWLQKEGFKKVFELKGGINSWIKAQKVIVL